MKLNPKYALSVLLFYSLLSFGQAEGVYSISGSHSRYGKFTGYGRINNGRVQRLIRFNDFKFEGKEVEEIWNGLSQGRLNFKLTLSNVLTSFNGYSPEDQVFQAPLEVSLSEDIFFREIDFKVYNGEIKEEWSFTGNEDPGPLWEDLRYSTEAVGKTSGLVRFFNKISKLNDVFRTYREHPEIKIYRERPEFKSESQYIIRDKTDADFYLQNPNVLRITNKITNPLSLAEALMRRNAYGHTLSEKEEILRQETLKYNFNEVGNLENAIVDENGNIKGKQLEYDTALWSSMFGWAELLRYQVTKDPAALSNYRLVLDSILTLVEITGDPTEFARGLTVSPEGENVGQGWIQGKGQFRDLKWREGGNNDMIKGVFLTLVLAHQVVKENEVELIQRIQKNVKALVRLKAVESRDFNLALALGLDALWNKDGQKLVESYKKIINVKNLLGKINDFENGIYFGGIADWSGIHLIMTSNFTQLLLAKELQLIFTKGEFLWRAQGLQKSAEAKLISMSELYKNTKRDYLILLNGSFIPKFQKRRENKEAINEAIWGLKEIPAPRSFGNAKADLSKHFNWSASAWPRLPWKAMKRFRIVKKDYDFMTLRQGAYSYPYFEGLAWSCTYIWKHSPYEPQFESHASIKTFSADYLLVYWAGRAGGLISSEE